MSELEIALEESLDRIQNRGATIEECLVDFPRLSSELRPLLLAAAQLESLQEIKPDRQFKEKARADLVNFMKAGLAPKQPVRQVQLPLRPTRSMRFATALAVLFLAFISAGTGLAQSAVPGDLLYPWKRATERIWLGFSKNDYEVELILSRRRYTELLAVFGRPELEQTTLQDYVLSVQTLISSPDEDFRMRVEEAVSMQVEDLVESGYSYPEFDELQDLMPLLGPNDESSDRPAGSPDLSEGGSPIPKLPGTDGDSREPEPEKRVVFLHPG